MADGTTHDAAPAAEVRKPHVHQLKCWTPHFDDVFTGRKPFEVRRDDRGFAVGDVLELQEFEPGIGYTGRTCRRTITFKFDATSWNGFGLMYGHSVLALGPDPDAEPGTVWDFDLSAAPEETDVLIYRHDPGTPWCYGFREVGERLGDDWFGNDGDPIQPPACWARLPARPPAPLTERAEGRADG